ncbi:hypothetical protein KPH14_005655 [Odynerus spinipes]|uniref:Uncharacterized protein n=1 Tax=Odynerus spinipes TaxID=1348599 RepID=A0AAD9VIW7_9HYME|nr:hypothetical protein KPH14_005655 [Odynerus spinipes]
MALVGVKIRPLYIFLFTIVILLTFQKVLAAPFTDSQDQRQNNPGFFARLTSRLLGDCVRIVSRLWQWIPRFPEWMRPSKPTLRLVRPTSIPLRDINFSSEETDR